MFVDGGSLDSGFNVLKGRDELRDFAGMVPTMAPGARHLVSNVSIDGDGDDATARLYLQMWATAGGAAEIEARDLRVATRTRSSATTAPGASSPAR